MDPKLIFKMFTNNTKQAVCTNTVIQSNSFPSSGVFRAIQACNRYCATRSSVCNVRFKKPSKARKASLASKVPTFGGSYTPLELTNPLNPWISFNQEPLIDVGGVVSNVVFV